MLKDKNALIEHFQKTHMFTETMDIKRDSTTRNPSSRSPNVKHRTIHLKNADDGPKKRTASVLMKTLKKHAKAVGKAAIMLEMMKPQMITHKKGAKPANYDACKSILEKSPFLRTKKDCIQLLQLVKNVKFFQNLGEQQQLDLCKVMGHQDVAWTRQTIMQQGDQGSTFYVILVGSFYVQVKVEESKNLKTVAHLHPGDSFGEAALINNNPRNATVVSGEPSELLMIEKEDYERVIKSLHVDALNKKSKFIRSIPAFRSFPEEIVKDLATRIFYEKVPIHHPIWKQGDDVDPMKYIMIVKHGEVHVIKDFAIQKFDPSVGFDKFEAPNKEVGSGIERKRADLCALGPSSAFFEASMFDDGVSNKEGRLTLEERKRMEAGEKRGSSLVTSSCCEIGWLSKHIFNQLTKFGLKKINNQTTHVEDPHAIEGLDTDQIDHRELKEIEASAEKIMMDLREWMIEYPSEMELRQLYNENKLWKELKDRVVKMTLAQAATKRLKERNKAEKELNIVEKVRHAKYGDHPLTCDVVLPFRKPVDLLPMSTGTDISSPEFGLAPREGLYDFVEKDLTPRSKVKHVDPKLASTFGYVSPTTSPRTENGKGQRSKGGKGKKTERREIRISGDARKKLFNSKRKDLLGSSKRKGSTM